MTRAERLQRIEDEKRKAKLPRVLNQRRFDSRVEVEGAVYVGRPSKWGNPYSIGRHGNRLEVIQLFRERVEGDPEFQAMIRRELRGKNLICWCAPQPCHADVLLEEANKE